MSAVLWRILIAVLAVLLFWALLTPLSHVLGFSLTGDVLTIVKICVAGLVILYIVFGGSPKWPTSS